MNKFCLRDVFTPSSPAKVTFVERHRINKSIVRALGIPGMQIVIYGHSGSGKTTLIENKLFQLYEKHIRTSCTKGMTFDQILLDAFDQLGEFYCDEVTSSSVSKVEASVQAAYLGIKSQIGAASEDSDVSKKKRVIPPQLTAQSLARLMGAAGYCWVIEDFHKIEDKFKPNLSQMMKVFMDVASQYKELKVVAIGAVNTAREVVQYDKEMRKRVAEIHVSLMTAEEVKEIIRKGCESLNIVIGDDLGDDIVRHSAGLAAICHKICYIMCDSADICETLEDPVVFDQADLQNALSEYINDESDTIKCAFDKALRLKGGEDVLCALAKINGDGARMEGVCEFLGNNSPATVSDDKTKAMLDELTTEGYGEAVKFDADSGKYAFSDPFVGAFALAYFEEKEKSLTKKKMTVHETAQLLDQVFRSFMQSRASSSSSFVLKEDSDESMSDGRE